MAFETGHRTLVPSGDGALLQAAAALVPDGARRRLVHYDSVRRRLWIAGQRCHHGATGAVLATVAGTGLLAARLKPRGLLALIATGGLLMAHDWHDREIWFERGWGNQP